MVTRKRRTKPPDDPYLAEMAKPKLLSRTGEMAAAREVERSTAALRLKILESPPAARLALKLLQWVRDDIRGRRRRTCSPRPTCGVTETAIDEKLTGHLATVAAIFETLDREFPTVDGFAAYPEWSNHRRAEMRRAASLLEELGIKFTRLSPLADRTRELIARDDPDSRRESLSTAEELRTHVRETERIAKRRELARQTLAVANLRLAVSTANRVRGRHLEPADAVQEANAGLLRAVDRFEYRTGFKFSTYAIPLIRSAVFSAISDKSRVVRVPVCVGETMAKVARISRAYLDRHGRDPTADEVAKAIGKSPAETRELLSLSLPHASLQAALDDPDRREIFTAKFASKLDAPEDACHRMSVRERVASVLSTLPRDERTALELRRATGDGFAYSPAQAARVLNVAESRVAELEASAVARLRAGHRRDLLDEDDV